MLQLCPWIQRADMETQGERPAAEPSHLDKSTDFTLQDLLRQLGQHTRRVQLERFAK